MDAGVNSIVEAAEVFGRNLMAAIEGLFEGTRALGGKMLEMGNNALTAVGGAMRSGARAVASLAPSATPAVKNAPVQAVSAPALVREKTANFSSIGVGKSMGFSCQDFSFASIGSLVPSAAINPFFAQERTLSASVARA